MEKFNMRMDIDWSKTRILGQKLVGDPLNIRIIQSGLPFLDALCLYGAIELYFGLNESVDIRDRGGWWEISGRILNVKNLVERRKRDLRSVKSIGKREQRQYVEGDALDRLIVDGEILSEKLVEAKGDFSGLDPTLQWGIRGVSASTYETLQSSQTSNSKCMVKIPLSVAILASAGKKRAEAAGDIIFLPVFNGRIDFSKIVSPLRFNIATPNITCAQALVLITLRTTLFSEGYYKNLSSVVYKTEFPGNHSDNYSGLINIVSTVLGKQSSRTFEEFLQGVYAVFKPLVEQGWKRTGKKYVAQDQSQHAVVIARWLLEPSLKALESVLTSQEQLHARYKNAFLIFRRESDVKEVFKMAEGRVMDHEAVRQFARTVERAIYAARMKEGKEPLKEWYNEVSILRSAPTHIAFFEHALVLIEQGHKEDSRVKFYDSFDPVALQESVGKSRLEFEEFRILFRMYLLQSSRSSSDDIGIKPESANVDKPSESEGMKK